LGTLAAGEVRPGRCSRVEVIDTHAHLERCGSPDAAIAGAAAAGVSASTIGRERAVELVTRHPRRGRSVWHAPGAADVVAGAPAATRPRGVALGEVGPSTTPAAAAADDQRRVFAAQIELTNDWACRW
jgi:hypothetical protein